MNKQIEKKIETIVDVDLEENADNTMDRKQVLRITIGAGMTRFLMNKI